MTKQHWPHIARQWSQVGPPLRPAAEDVAVFSRIVADWSEGTLTAEAQRSQRGGKTFSSLRPLRPGDEPFRAERPGSSPSEMRRPPRALILGVTPELYRLPWPAGADVLAADHTQEMIDAVWPGPREAAIHADWTALPLPDGSRDIVLCDGGIHLLTHPQAHEQLVRSVRRVLAPGGVCVLRLFVPPAQREAPGTVLQDLAAGRMSSLNVLKLRLAMSMQPSPGEGVQLSGVWDAVHRAEPDSERLAARLGWTLEHLLAINTYRDCPRRYHFVSVDEVRALFCASPGGFAMESVHVPTYELGERCPIVVFRRSGP